MNQARFALNDIDVARIMLCDLLIGRWLRLRANTELGMALIYQADVEKALDLAADLERVAANAERGLILWGGRNNRTGEDE